MIEDGCYCPSEMDLSGCDEGGYTHECKLESRVIELAEMNLIQQIWKQLTPDYIPRGSIEISKYSCEKCSKEHIEKRTLDKNNQRYGPFERKTIKVRDQELKHKQIEKLREN